MNETAFLLALSSAALHALWNALLKGSPSGSSSLMAAGAVSTILMTPCIFLWGRWEGLWAAMPYGVGSALLYIAYRLLLARAYQTGALSQAYAIARSAPVPIALGGVFLLGEVISPAAWGWMALMLGGVALLHLREFAQLFRPRTSNPAAFAGAWWACLTCITVAAYSLCDKAGVLHLDPLMYYGFFNGLSMTLYLGSLVFHEAGRDRARAMATAWRSEKGRILAIALLEPVSYVLVLAAFTTAPAGLVSAVRQVSVPLAAALGVWLFREPAGAVRLAGAALVALGAAGMKLWG